MLRECVQIKNLVRGDSIFNTRDIWHIRMPPNSDQDFFCTICFLSDLDMMAVDNFSMSPDHIDTGIFHHIVIDLVETVDLFCFGLNKL